MGLIFRQSLKSSIGFYLGVLIGAINTLFISTYLLSPDQISISRILLENSLIFAAFAHLSVPSISDRFLPLYKSSRAGQNAFVTLLFIIPLGGLLLFVLLFLIFYDNIGGYYIEKSPTIVPHLWLCIPITVAWVYIAVLEAYSRGLGRTAVPTFIREVVFRSLNVGTIIIFGMGWIDFPTFLNLYVASMFLCVVILLIYIKRLDKGFRFSIDFSLFPPETLKQFLTYGFIIVLGSVGVNLILFVDRNVIANQVGTVGVAIFIIASYIASIIEIPSKAIRQITGPILSAAVAQQDTVQVKSLYQKSAQNLLLVGGVIFALIIVNIHDLFSLLPKSHIYIQGVWIVVLLGLAKLIDMSLGMNNELIAFSKYYRYNTYFYLGLTVLAIVLNYWLIPIYGINGSAAATALITVISSGLRFVLVQRIYQLQPFQPQNWRIILAVVAIVCVGLAIPSLGTTIVARIGSIALRSCLMLGFLAIFQQYFPLSEELMGLYNKFRKK